MADHGRAPEVLVGGNSEGTGREALRGCLQPGVPDEKLTREAPELSSREREAKPTCDAAPDILKEKGARNSRQQKLELSLKPQSPPTKSLQPPMQEASMRIEFSPQT